MRVLVVEDELPLARFLVRGLREEGYQVDAVTHGKDARARLASLAYDVVILDWGLPDEDGIEIVRSLRRDGSRVPVLILSARGSTPERIVGLRAGADDYLPKPFDFTELLARLEAITRRATGGHDDREVGTVTLDARARCLRSEGVEIALTNREFAVAQSFFERAGEVLGRSELLLRVWGPDFVGDPNVLDVYLGYVRAKLAKLPGRVPALRAVRGVGFRLSLDEGAQ